MKAKCVILSVGFVHPRVAHKGFIICDKGLITVSSVMNPLLCLATLDCNDEHYSPQKKI